MRSREKPASLLVCFSSLCIVERAAFSTSPVPSRVKTTAIPSYLSHCDFALGSRWLWNATENVGRSSPLVDGDALHPLARWRTYICSYVRRVAVAGLRVDLHAEA